MSDEFWWPHLYRWVANYILSCEECQRVNPAPSSSALLKPLPIPTDCWKPFSLDFMFGMPPDHTGRTGLVVFVDRMSKMVRLVPYSTKTSGSFLVPGSRLSATRNALVHSLDQDPRYVRILASCV